MFRLLPALFLLENLINVRSKINNALVRNTVMKFPELGPSHTHDVEPGDYPFVISIILMDKEVVTKHCTGSMLSSVWAISASNCFYDMLDKEFYVWYANFTVNPIKTKMYTKVKRIFIHPSFLKTEFTRPGYFFGDNDVSLLRVKKIEITNLDVYGRLSAIDYTKMPGLPVKYIGGGTKNKQLDAKYDIQPLQIGEGVIIKCGLSLTMWSQYTQCVVPKCSEKLHQPIHGDSGGPFIYDGKIIGIMSVGYQIPKSIVMSNGLTPISPYQDWILGMTQPKLKSI